MKRRRQWVILALVIVAHLMSATAQAVLGAGSGSPEDYDEQLLANVGLSDTKDIIEWLKQRSNCDEVRLRFGELIRNLGDNDFEKRNRAVESLPKLGLYARPGLVIASKSSDPEVAVRAKACLERVPNEPPRVRVGPAMARILARRRPPEAIEVLLRYLPYTLDGEVEEEIYYALDALVTKKMQPELIAALNDPLPGRRAVAGCIVGRRGTADDKALVRKLLRDPESVVRLRAAQGLLAGNDQASIPVLIDLLGDKSASVAWQAEELLRYVAGDSAPRDVVGTRLGKKAKDCQDAWKGWWHEAEKSCDLGKLEKTGRRPGLLLICTWTKEPESATNKIWLCGCDGKPRPLIGELRAPWHAEWLTCDKLILADRDGIRVQTLEGEVEWQADFPATVWKYDLSRPTPRLQQSYPFIVYYSLGGEFQKHDLVKDKFKGEMWELSIHGKTHVVPFDESLDADDPLDLTFLHLPNGNWLAQRSASKKFVELNWRTGMEIRQITSSITPTEGAQAEVVSDPAGGFLFGCTQIGFDGKQVAKFCSKVLPVLDGARQNGYCRLHNCNTILQDTGTHIVEVSATGAVQWETSSDEEQIRSISNCLPLVRFGFEPRAQTYDLNSPSHWVEALHAASAHRRQYAMARLTSLGDKAVSEIPAIIDSAVTDESLIHCGLVGFGSERIREIMPELMKRVESEDPKARAAAVLILGALGEDAKESLPKLIACLKDKDDRVRVRAAAAVGRFDSQWNTVVPALAQFLDQDNVSKEAKHVGLISLERFHEHLHGASPVLRRFLKDTDVEVRLLVVRVLGTASADRETIDILGDALGDDDLQVKTNAARVIGNFGPKASEAIAPLVDALEVAQKSIGNLEQLSEFLETALHALGQMKDSGGAAVPALVRITAKADIKMATRQSAVRAIREIGVGAKPHVEAIRKAADEVNDDGLARELRAIAESLR